MTRCRFLVDECVPTSLARGLRRRRADVSVVEVGQPGAPGKGAPDAEILEYCQQEGRLLITADRATMPGCFRRHLEQGGVSWGVFLIGPDASLGRILDELVLVFEATEAEEWRDQLYYLPLFPGGPET